MMRIISTYLNQLIFSLVMIFFVSFGAGCSAHIRTGALSYVGSMPADAAEMDAAVWVDTKVPDFQFDGHFRPGIAVAEIIDGVKGLMVAVGLP